jgi:hypothetical protein
VELQNHIFQVEIGRCGPVVYLVDQKRMLLLVKGRVHLNPNKSFKVSNNSSNRISTTRRTFATKKCIMGTDEAGLGALLGPVGIIQVAVAAESTEAVNKAFSVKPLSSISFISRFAERSRKDMLV